MSDKLKPCPECKEDRGRQDDCLGLYVKCGNCNYRSHISEWRYDVNELLSEIGKLKADCDKWHKLACKNAEKLSDSEEVNTELVEALDAFRAYLHTEENARPNDLDLDADWFKTIMEKKTIAINKMEQALAEARGDV